MITGFRKHIGVCGSKVHSGHKVEAGLKRETAAEGRKSTSRDKSRKDQIQDRDLSGYGRRQMRMDFRMTLKSEQWIQGDTVNGHSIRGGRNNLQGGGEGVTFMFLLSLRHQEEMEMPGDTGNTHSCHPHLMSSFLLTYFSS